MLIEYPREFFDGINRSYIALIYIGILKECAYIIIITSIYKIKIKAIAMQSVLYTIDHCKPTVI